MSTSAEEQTSKFSI